MRWKNSLAVAKDSGVVIFFLSELSSKGLSPSGESSSSEEFPLVYILYILSCGKVSGNFSGNSSDEIFSIQRGE